MSKSAKTSEQSATSQRAAAHGNAAKQPLHAAGPADAIHESPRMTAQRQRAMAAFGETAQRVEDEEPLQGKFEAAQRVEEEEPLQGKFETAQRVEEEEPLQGKFEAAQRVEEEEPLQGKFEPAQRVEEEEPLQGRFETAQRMEEEEPLQGKFDAAQRMEEEEPLQGKFEPAQRVEEEEPLQGKFDTAQRVEEEEPLQAKETGAPANKTGMPDDLKTGIESMSGMDLSDVKVHRNSGKAAELQAHAYAQGNDIHVAPGQEKHLPHEAWHVVQQRQGRVKPTMQLQGVAVNDDAGLEQEADVMGAKALQRVATNTDHARGISHGSQGLPVAQRLLRTHKIKNDDGKLVQEITGDDFLVKYGQLMAGDTSVLVDGDPVGETGLKKTLLEDEVAGGALSTDFVESIMGRDSWLPNDEQLQQSLVDYVRSENTHLPEVGSEEGDEDETNEQYMRALDFGTDYAEHVKQWISDTADLDGATTVAEVDEIAEAVPAVWRFEIPSLVYEQTRTRYYGPDVAPAYVAPFKKMIGDTNSNAITSYEFVEKYGSEAAGTLGAEFKVAAPAEMVGKYNDKAVLHTHYATEDSPPNYGHTKPYEQRFAKGFGYTMVKTSAIKAVDDSSKTYDEL